MALASPHWLVVPKDFLARTAVDECTDTCLARWTACDTAIHGEMIVQKRQ